MLLAACRFTTPEPQLRELIPHAAVSVATTPIEIRGSGFSVRITKHLFGKTPVTIDQRFQAWLGDTELEAVTYVDSNHLTAIVPAGLPLGAHTLTVVDPFGASVTLFEAFVVQAEETDVPPVVTSLSQLPAALPALVSTGQTVTFETIVTNDSDVPVDAFLPAISLSGSAQLTLVSSASPAAIPAHGSAAFVFTYTVAASGDFFATFTGPSLATASTTTVIAVNAAALALVDFEVAPNVESSATFTATLTLQNVGEAAAIGVLATAADAVTPAPQNIAGGASASFELTFTAGAMSGARVLTASAQGTDEISVAIVSLAGLSTSTQVLLSGVAEELASDVFADGTTFAHVFSYAGQIYLGPRGNGTGAVRMNPDGTGAESVAFSFGADTTGLDSRNAAAAPFSSIGATGCTIDTQGCGPDNEDGRGLFFSGLVGADEWLGVAGSRSSDFDYIYLSRSTGAMLTFAYVDLSFRMNPNAKTLSAAHFFGNALYLGITGSGGGRPSLMRLQTMPSWPSGLDAGAADFIELDAQSMPGLSSGNTTALIDTISSFNDRLYLANNGAFIRSTNAVPEPYGVDASDWAAITPSTSVYTNKTSITTTKGSDLEPADKAVPAMVTYRGKLYAARNTTTGPQLFGCSATECNAADWTAIALNSSGDTQLTQWNDAANTRVTLLVATATTLYVGFDNATTGAQIWKTTALSPLLRSDFTQVGAGLGSNATRLFDARGAVFDDLSFLYVSAGTGAGAVRVYRVLD